MNELDEFDNAVLCMYDANSAGKFLLEKVLFCMLLLDFHFRRHQSSSNSVLQSSEDRK